MASLLFTEEECAAHSDTLPVKKNPQEFEKISKKKLQMMKIAANNKKREETLAAQKDALNRLNLLRMFLEGRRPDKGMDIHEVQWLRQLCDLSVIPQTKP